MRAQYVRDPDGVFSARTVIPFKPDVRLPVGSTDTGYHLGDLALWVAHDAGKAVYIVRGSHVERWPRARPQSPVRSTPPHFRNSSLPTCCRYRTWAGASSFQGARDLPQSRSSV